MTRVFIDDLETPYEYSDSRIQQVIVVAGRYVQTDIVLENNYTFDVINSNIVPDPVDIKDEVFNTLVPLKAACIIDQGTFRTKAALEGIKTVLGPASLSIDGNIGGWKSIIEHGACALYKELTDNWDIRKFNDFRAILSPFVSNTFDPRNLNVPVYRNTLFS
jgi:hypothetical protein